MPAAGNLGRGSLPAGQDTAAVIASSRLSRCKGAVKACPLGRVHRPSGRHHVDIGTVATTQSDACGRPKWPIEFDSVGRTHIFWVASLASLASTKRDGGSDMNKQTSPGGIRGIAC